MSTSPEDSPQSLYQKSSERDILPIILDSSQSPISTSDLVERTNQDGGLLASTRISAALLSMSDFGKTYVQPEGSLLNVYQSNLLSISDYENTNSTNMYLAYAQQSMNPPHLQGDFARNSDPVYSAYDARIVTHDEQPSWESASTSPPPQQLPEIVSWSPRIGSQGSTINITLRSSFAINTVIMNLCVKFGSAKSSNITLTPLKADSTHFQYALCAEVPKYGATGWISYDVPVTLVAHDQAGNVITSLKLEGSFSYTTTSTSITPLQASPIISRKRRLSDSNDSINSLPVAKRVATLPQVIGSNYGARSYGYDQQNSGYIHASSHMSAAPSMSSTYGRPISQTPHIRHVSPAQVQPSNTPSNGSQLLHNSPHARSWSSSNMGTIISKSSSISGVTRRVNTMGSPSSVSTPRLIRTSQISQSPSPASTPSVVAPVVGNFNPYTMYPHKAQLKINGELDTITQNWTPDERDVQRRLVQFWRSQTGSTISASFAPVAPEDRQPNAICISCIWWEEKDQYYVTSVDTIFLLESLVAVRFTVEEKNRIRRNLEGFRPLTVSKGKPDSEDFFKLIMGFPNPKPRNIEKDVKVYSWKILAMALKKIIGKYSASYSSIASSTIPAMNSYHSAQDITSNITPASPHSAADSALSISYQSPLIATSMPTSIHHHHHHQNSMGSTYTTSGVLPTTMATSYPLYSYPQAQQSNHPSSHLSYAPSQQSSHHVHDHSHRQQQQHHHHHSPASWDSAISMQPQTSVNSHGMYSFGTSPNHGLDHYQVAHSQSGS